MPKHRGFWERDVVTISWVPFTVFYLRKSLGLERHILQVLITIFSVNPFLSCCNHTAVGQCWNVFDTKPVKTSELLSAKGGMRQEIRSPALFKTGTGTVVCAHPRHHSCYSCTAFCACVIWVLMDCCGGWTHRERMQSRCPCVKRPGHTTFLCVPSAGFHAVQSTTDLEHWRNDMESWCVYYGVLSLRVKEHLRSNRCFCLFYFVKDPGRGDISFNPF